MEASPLEYRINGLEKLDVARGRLADELWPEQVKPINLPRVKRSKSGEGTVTPWPESEAARPALEEAEVAYKARDYEAAAVSYRKAIAASPREYILHAYLGDALLFGGDTTAALNAYQRAIDLNPDDYRLYFFRGNAHRRGGDLLAMLNDLRTSLVLKPRNAVLLGALQDWGPSVGLRVEPDAFVPRAFARLEGEAIGIYADTSTSEWLGWGICKGLWLGEASHRKEMLGHTKHVWSWTEEAECLNVLGSLYLQRREAGEGPVDDRLERLVAIIKSGHATGFVLYEMGSRVDPQLMLRQNDELRAKVRAYVERYVLTSTPKEPSPKKKP